MAPASCSAESARAEKKDVAGTMEELGVAFRNGNNGMEGESMPEHSANATQTGRRTIAAEGTQVTRALELHFEPPVATRPPAVRQIEVEVGAA